MYVLRYVIILVYYVVGAELSPETTNLVVALLSLSCLWVSLSVKCQMSVNLSSVKSSQ